MCRTYKAHLDKAERQRDALLAAAKPVLRDALDRIDMHPCDDDRNDLRVKRCSAEIQELYAAIAACELDTGRG